MTVKKLYPKVWSPYPGKLLIGFRHGEEVGDMAFVKTLELMAEILKKTLEVPFKTSKVFYQPEEKKPQL